MGAGWSVLVPGLGQLCFRKSRRESHESWPEPAVDVRDLAADQLAHEDVGVLRNSLREAKDLLTLGMPPPAASNRATRNRLGQTGHRPVRSLQHYAMEFDEGQALPSRHVSSKFIVMPLRNTAYSLVIDTLTRVSNATPSP